MKYEDYLAHFNPNHDPKNGQFASSNSNHEVVSKSKKKTEMIKTLRAARDTILVFKSVLGITVGVATTVAILKAASPAMKELLSSSVGSINRTHQQFTEAQARVAQMLADDIGNMTTKELKLLGLR